jgi:hypothetical protein
MLAQNLRNANIERLLVTKVKRLNDDVSSVALSQFVSELFDYLSIVESCPDQLLPILLALIENESLYSKKAFGEFLVMVSISNFHFSAFQRQAIVAAIEKQYPTMGFDLKRMTFLVILRNYLSISKFSEVLIQLYKREAHNQRPVAELVWELNVLKNDLLLPIAERAKIEETMTQISRN